jgi:acetate kinase
MVCEDLEFLGAKINLGKNNVRGKEAFINEPDSRVSILVIPTNEELVIARDTKELAID